MDRLSGEQFKNCRARLASAQAEADRLMKYFVYVLLSLTFRKTYVGSTTNLNRRIAEHNSGKNYFTKRYVPWNIVFKEEFDNLTMARSKEKYLKSASGRRLVLKEKISKSLEIIKNS